ncbi:MAG: hypothetical protein KDA36_09110 [Planctomycetaceae bacterium]|nr:hypothetical protein [Planctomycetaceae bacterium]
MLTEQKIHNDINRRSWVMLPYMVFGVVTSLSWLLLAKVILQPHPGSLEAILILLPSFPVFLIPAWLGERKANRIQTICPICHKVLNGNVRPLLLTRRCPECGTHIVEGAFRTEALLNRYRRYLNWHLARRVHWILVIFMLFPLLIFQREIRDPNFPPVSWPFSLLILLASTYLWFRTRNHRCAIPFLTSLFLLAFDFWRIWNTAAP